jgi:exosortase D (VPLPA-CTERM-specific)
MPKDLSKINSPSSLLDGWVFALLAMPLLLVFCFFDSIMYMVNTWLTLEEYSHALILPFLSGYLIWQRRLELARVRWVPHWSGLLLIFLALSFNALAKMAALYAVQQYSFVLAIYGLVVCIGGWRLLKTLVAPMLLFLFMVPLPFFFLNNLSAELQLLSSQIGVFFIRLAGISVYLEGNVIDLGVYKLQVQEACSGLRYLFPLMTMGFVMAYLFRTVMWKRLLVFLSSIPLTIFMNSLRIGVIGVMVEHWGIAMAEGFLHEFQGWAVFMLSTGVLLLEIILLSRFGHEGKSWRDLFGSLHASAAITSDLSQQSQSQPFRWVTRSPLTGAFIMLVVFAPTAWLLSARPELIPQRSAFVEFPQQIDGWEGHRSSLDQTYLDVLKLDDYIVSDYVDQNAPSGLNKVNFYSAWYDSQRAGQSAHSPRTCLPGDGWIIGSLTQVSFEDMPVSGRPLQVNRVVIEKGASKQLVYYWFQQRGRVITNEYMVKWYLFLDSLTRQRTDGALVRLIIQIPEGQPVEPSEQTLQRFMQTLAPKLESYIPG